MEARHPVVPLFRHLQPIAASEIEPGTAGVLGADLEARGVDDAVEVIVLTVGYQAGLGDLGDPFAISVDEMSIRLVVGVEVLIVETRTFAQLAEPRLEGFSRVGVSDDLIDPGPDLGHLLVIALVVRPLETFRREIGFRVGEHTIADALRKVSAEPRPSLTLVASSRTSPA